MPTPTPDPVGELLPKLADFLADADQLLCGKRGAWATSEDLLPSPDSPLDLMLRLRTEAMHAFHALLRVTDDPMASPAGAVLVRQLLECWAHVYWIAVGKSTTLPEATPEQRAVCLELGMARWLVTNLANSSTESQSADAKADAKRWLSGVASEHQKSGCTCKGRDFGAVRKTLTEMRDLFEMNWPLDTYIAASAASHALMPQRLAHANDAGQLAWGGPASLLDRQNWLSRGWTCLINVYLFVLGLLATDKLDEYNRLVEAAQAQVRRANQAVIAITAESTTAGDAEVPSTSFTRQPTTTDASSEQD